AEGPTQELAHAPPVRTLPVYPVASLAPGVAPVDRGHAWRQPIRHRFLVHEDQRQVAVEAEGEGPGARRQLQPVDHFTQLILRPQRVDEATVSDRAALEQLAIARQHNPRFDLADGPDL